MRAILAGAGERRLLAERRARDGNRRVTLLDGRYVLKEYEWPTGRPPRRRPWAREHAALTRLGGGRLPASVGWVTEPGNAGVTVRYLRGYAPGTPLDGFDARTAAEAGALLASLHERRVVTDDALTQNFLRAPDGRLFFLDFGKARVFRRASPLLPVWAALEHCRFLRASLGGDPALWDTFRRAYFEASGRGPLYATAVRGLTLAVLGVRRLQGRRR